MTRHKKFVLSAILVIFTGILFCVSVTLAWFSNNREVKERGQKIYIYSPVGIEIGSYHVYKRNGTTNKAEVIFMRYASDDGSMTTYKLDEDTGELVVSDLQGFTFEMSEYDQIFTDKNVNTPVVVRVVLQDVNIDKATGEFPIISCEVSTRFIELMQGGKIRQDLSNILTISCGVNDSLKSYDPVTESEEIYQDVVTMFQNEEEYLPLQFVELTTIGHDDDMDVDLYSAEKQGSLFFEIDPNLLTVQNSQVVVYFEFNYDPTLIQHFITTNGYNLGQSAAAGMDVIIFDNDLSFIEFTYVEE